MEGTIIVISQCLDATYIFSILFTYFFQVMIQPHNRHMSFSLYISALAVADTTVLLNGKCSSLFYDITRLTLQFLGSKNSSLS